jgi:hypothetical protein
MKGLDDIKSVLVHIITFLGIFVDNVQNTVLYQMMDKMLSLIHQPTFADWFDKYGEDFIFTAFRAIEQIIIYHSKFAADLYNVNAVMLTQPNVSPVLDGDHLERALSVIRMFETNVNNAIANESVLLSQSGVALSYKTLAIQASEVVPPPRTNATESKPTVPGSTDNSKQQKARPSQSSAESKPKKPRRIKVDTAPAAVRKDPTELGMIIPAEGISKDAIMPPGIKINGKDVCMDFACVGHSCPHPFGSCPLLGQEISLRRIFTRRPSISLVPAWPNSIQYLSVILYFRTISKWQSWVSEIVSLSMDVEWFYNRSVMHYFISF